MTTLFLIGTMLLGGTIRQVGEHTFHHRVLENGLQALVVDDGVEGEISIFIVYGVGNRAETAETTGLAHLVEHTLFTGTERMGDDEHDARIKELGGESNAYTREDFTVYYAHNIPVEALGEVLGMEVDRMRGLTFNEEAFLGERESLRVEEVHANNPEIQIGALRDFAVWKGVGYGAGILNEDGNTQGPQLTLEIVKAFYDRWYHPRNGAVVVVGGGSPHETMMMIEGAFGGIPSGPIPPSLPTLLPSKNRDSFLEAPLTRDRLEWVWGGPSLEDGMDRLALTLLAKVFQSRNGKDGSPVMSWMGGRAGEDLFVIAATGTEAEKEVESLWDEMTRGDWDEEEMESARELLKDGYTSMPLRSRPYFSLAVDVAAMAVLGYPDWPSTFAQRVDAITREDLLRVGRAWLSKEMRFVLRFDGTATESDLPQDAEGLRHAAEAAEASGDLPKAIAAYEALLALGASKMNRVIYRYYLGDLNFRLGDLEAAQTNLLAGLEVVEYPALREMLVEVEAALAGDTTETEEAMPVPVSESESGFVVIGTTGEEAPSWASEGTSVMRQLESWRGLPFQTDLVVEFLEADEEGPAGWYESDTKRLVVTLKGTERFGRGTMLHEMFHALQDQQYDLMAVHLSGETVDEDRAIGAIIEGEAMLAVQEIMDYDFSQHTGIPLEGLLDEERFEKIFHYGDGLQFVLAVREALGWEGVSEVFAHPPSSSAEVFHPERYLAGWKPQVIQPYPLSQIGEGEEIISSEAEGEYGLRLFLSMHPDTRPFAPEIGEALLGDLHTVVLLPTGERWHIWKLSFSGNTSYRVEMGNALRAMEPSGGTFSLFQHGDILSLSWIE